MLMGSAVTAVTQRGKSGARSPTPNILPRLPRLERLKTFYMYCRPPKVSGISLFMPIGQFIAFSYFPISSTRTVGEFIPEWLVASPKYYLPCKVLESVGIYPTYHFLPFYNYNYQ